MQTIPSIPPEIVRSVRAVFGSSNFYLLVGDQLAAILAGLHVTGLLAAERPAALGVPVLALVTYFQFVEGLSDMQAADALRSRQEWKYALHLPVIAPVIPEADFCLYRQEVLVDPVALRELEALFFRLNRLDCRQPPLPEIPKILASICSLNRLLWLYEAMDSALKLLAGRHQEWLGEVARPYWYTLYRTVAPGAGSWAHQEVADGLSLTIGADICYLLRRIEAAAERDLAAQGEILALQKLWQEQFAPDESGRIGLRQRCAFCGAGSAGASVGEVPGCTAGGGGYGEDSVYCH
jgi:transposase